MRKYLLLGLGLLSMSVQAASNQTKEMYVNLEDGVKLVITNDECKKWRPKDAGTLQLNYAYAINEKGDTVTGCWTHAGDMITVELTEDNTTKVISYHYDINANNFLPKATL